VPTVSSSGSAAATAQAPSPASATGTQKGNVTAFRDAAAPSKAAVALKADAEEVIEAIVQEEAQAQKVSLAEQRAAARANGDAGDAGPASQNLHISLLKN
jgi:hypothetical protein